MKASLKFREDQKPLFRAKVPLNILGFPFQSGIVCGESKELSLNLSTFCDSGPSVKLAYRPNDCFNPLSLVFKTGIGHFGSPNSSPMTMSAEFNFVGGQSPSFFVHFKPRLGDFSIKKSQSSSFAMGEKMRSDGVVSDDDSSMEILERPLDKGDYSAEKGLFYGYKSIGSPLRESAAAKVMESLLSGTEVSARTGLPLKNRAVMNFRWGVRFPAVDDTAASVMGKTHRTGGMFFRKFPLLVMNKIEIEHVAKEEPKADAKSEPLPGNVDRGLTCSDVKRQVEVIQTQSAMLRKTMDDLRSEMISGRSNAVNYREVDKAGGRHSGGKMDWRSDQEKRSTSEVSGFVGKTAEGEGNEEPNKSFSG